MPNYALLKMDEKEKKSAFLDESMAHM